MRGLGYLLLFESYAWDLGLEAPWVLLCCGWTLDLGFLRHLGNVEFSGQVEEGSPGGEGCSCGSGIAVADLS